MDNIVSRPLTEEEINNLPSLYDMFKDFDKLVSERPYLREETVIEVLEEPEQVVTYEE